MKKLILLLVIAGAGYWWAVREGFVDSPLGEPAHHVAFQEFAIAMVRGDMASVERLSTTEEVNEQAHDTYAALRRFVRDVFTVNYRFEREQASGNRISMVVGHTMRLDLEGTNSAFGTVRCSGRYEVTLERDGERWRVASFSFEEGDPLEGKLMFNLGHPDTDARWPCVEIPRPDSHMP